MATPLATINCDSLARGPGLVCSSFIHDGMLTRLISHGSCKELFIFSECWNQSMEQSGSFILYFLPRRLCMFLQFQRALEFLRDSPQLSNPHTLLSEQSEQTGKCPMSPSTHTPWLGVLYFCLNLPRIIASSSGDPGTPETGRSLMVDVAYQESGLAFLIVPVTTPGIGRVWDKCV